MITRSNLLLAVVVVVLLVLRSGSRGDGLEAPISGPAFPGLEAQGVLRLEVRGPGGGEAPVVLERDERGGAWRVADRRGFPALGHPIEELLGAVANLGLEDVVSEEAASHGLYGVAEGEGNRLVLSASGGGRWELVVGDVLREGGGRAAYARPAGDARTFRVQGLAGASDPGVADPAAWLDAHVARFDASAVTRVELSVAGITLALVRDDAGFWAEESSGAELPRVGVEDLIGDVAALVLADVATTPFDPESLGFGADRLSLTLRGGEDFEPVELALGGSEPAEEAGVAPRRYLHLGSWTGDWVGLLPPEPATGLLEAVLELLQSLGG